MDSKTKLEVGLLGRTKEFRNKGMIYANVTSAQIKYGEKYITVHEKNKDSRTLSISHLNLNNYWIKSITMTPSVGWGDTEETFRETQEDQNEAFETLLLCVKEVEEESSLEDTGIEEGKEMETSGPKRIELTLVKKTLVYNTAGVVEKIVLTSLLGPSQNINYYTAVGRRWLSGVSLTSHMSHFSSSHHWIKEIVFYKGGSKGSVATVYFNERNQDQAWSQLDGMYKNIKLAELTVVRTWDPFNKSYLGNTPYSTYDDDDLSDIYNNHYTQRTPYHYQAPTGYFRVAGDSVGAELFRTQESAKTKGPQTLEELVALEKNLRDKAIEEARKAADQKAAEEAQKKEQPSKTSEQSGTNPSGKVPNSTPETVAQYCDCGHPGCEDCYWTEKLNPPSRTINATLH